MRDGGVVKGSLLAGTANGWLVCGKIAMVAARRLLLFRRKALFVMMVLAGLVVPCLSAYAETLEYEFGTVTGERMRPYYEEGVLYIEISDPFPVKVTIAAKEYTDEDGKEYTWNVTPSSFYFTGVRVECNATLSVDKHSEDSRKIVFVPWQKIDVYDVVLYSPNPEKGWPYDPVYDDPIWEMTVQGSLSVAAANNQDKAPVGYSLNKTAVNVEIVAYKDKWYGKTTEGAGSFVGTPTTNKGRNKVEAWIIKDQDVDDGYFVEVTAYGDRGDKDTDKSQTVGIKREKYYTSTATELPGEVPVGLVAEVAGGSGTGLKIIETGIALVGVLPGAGIPAAVAGIALTWCPPPTAPWKDDHFAIVMNGEWEMKMFLWEKDKYVNKDEVTGFFTQEIEAATFSVCYERVYHLGWLSSMAENGTVPPADGLGISPVVGEETMSGALNPQPIMFGFMSNYKTTVTSSPVPTPYGEGVTISTMIGSASLGPTLGNEFFTERKVRVPSIASTWEKAQPSQSN